MTDEGNCARLIRMAMGLGELGGAIVVDQGYTDEEIRVADETVKREKGPKFAVVRGTITFHENFGAPRDAVRSQVLSTRITRREGT